MNKQFHILNGDTLLYQFSESIPGVKIVMREALIEGTVEGDNLSDFYTNRAQFFIEHYKLANEKEYFEKSVSEINKIQKIPTDSAIHLWFEDDLFCQINFWFVLHLIQTQNSHNSVYLVRPNIGNEYSFGMMSKTELNNAFLHKIQISSADLIELAKLWRFYQKKKYAEIVKIATAFRKRFPFLLPAVNAHLERNLDNDKPGRPETSLRQILAELSTKDFDPIFREFCKREAIYGFGDLQVKRLFDKITNKLPNSPN